MSTWIALGATERIEAMIVADAGTPLTSATDIMLDIRRLSDGKWLDFSDLVFKSVGWTARQKAMTEVSSSLAPGRYYYSFVTATYAAADIYELTIQQSPATTFTQVITDELRVGNVPNTVSGLTLPQFMALKD